uniref:helix-turn-helix domain-containing protein n=1 Tax=Shouchella clausii TaxID=79880 RepID=UPI0039838401
MSCYHQLTTFDRARIETMPHLGMSLRQIAKNLGHSPSTISRERRRLLINRRRPKRWLRQEAHRNHIENGRLSKLSDGVSLARFPLKRFIGGFIKGVYNGQRLYCVVKGKTKNPRKPVGASPLVHPSSRGLKRYENERC